NEHPSPTTFKKVKVYEINGWEYKYPKTVIQADGTVTNLYPIDTTNDTLYSYDKINLTDPDDCLTAVGGSIYHLTHGIHGGGVTDPCMHLVANPTSAFPLPTDPTDSVSVNNARNSFLVLRNNLSGNDLITNFDKKFAYDMSDGVGAMIDTDRNIFIVVHDEFAAEPLLDSVTSDDVSVSISYATAS